jgi:DNA-binding response OmpR family regulator
MTDDAATILIVEDDDATRTFLADNLTADGYDVLVADCARDGLRLLESKFPDVVLVDVGLPDASGLDLLRRVREADGLASRVNPATPLLVLSGRDGELDRVRGFEAGADDYLGKPFSYAELRLRIAAMLRRADSARAGRGRMRVGDLRIDVASRDVVLRGDRIALSQKEFALLRTLATHPTKVWGKEELLRTVWGFRSMGSTRTLDSHACRLRQKLGTQGDRFVLNVWGVGYRLVDAAPPEDPLREPQPEEATDGAEPPRRGRFAVAVPGMVA